jgi:hypothetical protein
MPSLFDQTEINGLALENRIVRSATWEGPELWSHFCRPRLFCGASCL